MKPLITTLLVVAVGLLAAMTSIARPHLGATVGQADAAGTSALREMHIARAAKLPAEDFEDRSLVFPRESKP